MGNEFGRMAHANKKTGTVGTKAIFIMTHDKSDCIPEDRVVMYVRIVIGFCPQKEDPTSVCIIAGGNLIKMPGYFTTRTPDLTMSKILWNSILSTEGAKFVGFKISNFYLGTDMKLYEYMNMLVSLFPQHTIDQYNMDKHKQNGHIYLTICKAAYGLPATVALANLQTKVGIICILSVLLVLLVILTGGTSQN